LGTVSDRDALKLVRRGEKSLTSMLRPVSQSVDESEILLNLFVPSVESSVPLAVTDAEDRLVGVIPRVTLLAALGPGPNSTDELTVPLQPVAAKLIDELLGDTPGAAANETEEVR